MATDQEIKEYNEIYNKISSILKYKFLQLDSAEFIKSYKPEDYNHEENKFVTRHDFISQHLQELRDVNSKISNFLEKYGAFERWKSHELGIMPNTYQPLDERFRIIRTIKEVNSLSSKGNPNDLMLSFEKIIHNLEDPEGDNPLSMRGQLDKLYKSLRESIEENKVGESDPLMDEYLKKCDEIVGRDIKEVIKNGEPTQVVTYGNYNTLIDKIKEMQVIKAGLNKRENQFIKEAIATYNTSKETFFSRNMGAKQQRIEAAMQSIPIEERAKLLESNHRGVKDLFDAMAWRRKMPCASRIKEGVVEVDNSATLFKEFTRRFKNEIQQAGRTDIQGEDFPKPQSPKR